MDKNFESLKKCLLFRNVREEDYIKIINCLGGYTVKYKKDQLILEKGEVSRHICIVLSGSVQVVRDYYNGSRVIINRLGPSGIVGESVAITENTYVPVDVIAETDCEILMIDGGRVMNPCHKNCHFHINMIKNLLDNLAIKNIWLTQRIEITSRKTTREKLMAFLSMVAKDHGGNEFTIPFDRQELADFLGVERSAMSAEISKLRAEGIIESNRSWFRIL